MKKVMGLDHEVNLPKISHSFLNDRVLVALKLTFKELLWNFFKKINGIYHYTYNAFFTDLPGPSFVAHSSLLIAKSVDFVVGT